MSGPGIPTSGILHPFSFVTDLVPTILDLSGSSALPGGPAFTGRSLTEVLQGRSQTVYGPDDPVSLEASGQSAVFKGDYKLVRNLDLYGDGIWRLHNIVLDPGETRDLTAEQPARAVSMLQDYETYVEEYGVQPMPPGYSGTKMIADATTQQIIDKDGVTLMLAALGIAVALLAMGFVLFRILSGTGMGAAVRNLFRRNREVPHVDRR